MSSEPFKDCIQIRLHQSPLLGRDGYNLFIVLRVEPLLAQNHEAHTKRPLCRNESLALPHQALYSNSLLHFAQLARI